MSHRERPVQFASLLVALRLLAAATLLAATLPVAPHAQPAAETKPSFELLHLWMSPIEQPGLLVLRGAILRAGLDWREHRVNGNFNGVRRELATRMALGVSPTAVFWIGGFVPKSHEEAKVFRYFDHTRETQHLKRLLLPEISNAVSSERGLIGLPLVIHLQNVAVFNDQVFKAMGIARPSSWAEFLRIAPSIEARGTTPLAVSGQKWLFRFLYLSILADGLNPDEFEDLLAARMQRDKFRAITRRSFEVLRALKPYANTDYPVTGWDQAIRKVVDGEAALTITGDFAAPILDGVNVQCAPPPGSEFVMWSFDVMAFPAGTDTAVQDIALRSLATKDVLTEFGIAKGGVPVVANVAPSALNPCSRVSLERWQKKKKILLSAEEWTHSLNVVSGLAEHVWATDDVDLDQIADSLLVELSGVVE